MEGDGLGQAQGWTHRGARPWKCTRSCGRTPALAADALLGRGGREALGRSDAPGVAYQAEGSPRESEG